MSLSRLVRLAVGLVACLLVVSCSGEGASVPAPPRAGAPAPEGHRWVGAGGVVVAVPDWWTTGDTECLLPVEDTVYVETGAMTDCAFTVPPTTPTEVSSLAVVDTGSAHGSRLLEDLSVDGEVGGEPVLSGRECGWLAPRVCRSVLAVPSRGVAFVVHVSDPGDVDLAVLRGSLRLQPDAGPRSPWPWARGAPRCGGTGPRPPGRTPLSCGARGSGCGSCRPHRPTPATRPRAWSCPAGPCWASSPARAVPSRRAARSC